MQITPSSLPVPQKLFLVSLTASCCPYWAPAIMAQTASSFVFIPLFLSLLPLMLQLTLYVIAHFVLPSFILHPVLALGPPLPPLTSAKYLGSYMTPTSSSVRDVPSAALRPLQPSKPLTHCFVILSSLRSSNLGSIPESYNASSSTALNHRSILPLSFQKLTLSITRP